MSAYFRNLTFSAVFALVLLGLVAATGMGQMAWADESSSLQSGVMHVEGKKANQTDGWRQVGKHWQYWQDGERLKSTWVDTSTAPVGMKRTFKTHRYWIDANGKLAVNRLIDPQTEADAGAYYAYATDAGYVATGKYRVEGPMRTRVYLARTEGKRVGQLETGGSRGLLCTDAYDNGVQRCYYIDPTAHAAVVMNDVSKAKPVKVTGFGWVLPCNKGGFLLTGAKKIMGDRVYLANERGKLETGGANHVLATKKYDNGTLRYYYIDPTKHCAVVNDKPVLAQGYGWVFPCNAGGYLLTNAKKTVGSYVYLAQPNGKLETGNIKIGNTLTNIVKTSRYDGTVRYYYINPYTHSAVVRNTLVQVPGYGWVLPNNAGGYLATGRTIVNKKLYLIRENGIVETGDHRGFLATSYYDPNGVRQRYYIDPQTHTITYGVPVYVKDYGYVYAPNEQGYLLRGNTRVDDQHVILANHNGRICNERGWVGTSDFHGSWQRYWLEPTWNNSSVLGARVGYFWVDGMMYQGLDTGYVLRDTTQIYDSAYYYVDGNGTFWRNDVVTHLYQEAQGYWSPSQYLIMVDIDDPKVLVLEGWQGNWSIKFVWDCCTGAPWTPTCEGTFSVGDKGFSFGEGNGYSCYYWTQIYGGYLFHTRLYYAYTWDLMDGTIGERCSHGCVRMYTDDAKWIWDNVPRGTTVACIY